MDRFFSKLDLRDIKIDPFKTSFPPDAEDEAGDDESVAQAASPETPTTDGSERRPHVPAWVATRPAADGSVPSDGHGDGFGDGFITEVEIVETTTIAVTVECGAPEPVLAGPGEVLKVSARSRPSAVAGAIAGVVRENGRAEVQAIGAGATNQAVKAVAIARDYLRETGIEAICLPAFIDVTIDNEDRTAIRLVVEPR